MPGCSIRRCLLADVCSDLLQFEPDGRNSITAGPEMLTREVSFLTAYSSDRNGAFPFQEPDHRRHRVLGRNRDAHVHVSTIRWPSMIWHSFCRANAWKIAPSCRRVWPKMAFRRRKCSRIFLYSSAAKRDSSGLVRIVPSTYPPGGIAAKSNRWILRVLCNRRPVNSGQHGLIAQ